MKYVTKSLLHRPACGSLVPHATSFNTDFVREAAEGLASVSDAEVIEAALQILAKRISAGPVLGSMKAAKEYLAIRFGDLEHEVFSAIYLDGRHRVIACEELFRGTIDGASIHPRIVVKEALRFNAAALVIGHNHPSGNPSPSAADEAITQRLKQALDLVDIRLLDHIVTGAGSAVSFVERGLL